MTTDTLPVSSIRPNPNQPRKRFNPEALADLAASIKENGLLQPITVRPIPTVHDQPGHWQIVAGERRWRAHQLAGIERIAVNIVEIDDAQTAITAIVENLQRSDITPLEEARAYQRALDTGMSVEGLAQKLGLQQPWRITDRTALLRLKPEYLDLLEKGHLSPSQGTELSRLEPADQDALFGMIRDGRCESYTKLRAAADGILGARSQASMFEDNRPSAKEQEILSRFEKKIEQMVKIVNAGFKDGEVNVLRKINPHRASIVVQQVGLISKHLAMIEREIQRVVAQGELATH